MKGDFPIVGPSDVSLRSGIFSFNIDGWDPTELAMHLDEEYNIAVRSGMHCVHSWFNSRGINGTDRTARVTVKSIFNRFVLCSLW